MLVGTIPGAISFIFATLLGPEKRGRKLVPISSSLKRGSRRGGRRAALADFPLERDGFELAVTGHVSIR